MAYTERNYKTKEELKEALSSGEKIRVYHPGMGTIPENGKVFIEGPHYPQPHMWYAEGEMREGFLVKVE